MVCWISTVEYRVMLVKPPMFKFKNFIAAKMTWKVFSKNQLNSIQQSKRKKIYNNVAICILLPRLD